jgi:hypothetical protein
MKDYVRIFSPGKSGESDDQLITGAMACLDGFSDQFNAENPAGMDDYLHFPHMMLSGSEVLEWKEPGQLSKDFFAGLRKLGWKETRTLEREVVLVSQDKVHVRVKYARVKADGTVISEHENLWILVRRDDRWGIVVRSY